MTTVINAHGRAIDFDVAASYMDYDLFCREVEGLYSGDQAIFDAYCKSHLAAYGAEFEPNKPNPVW